MDSELQDSPHNSFPNENVSSTSSPKSKKRYLIIYFLILVLVATSGFFLGTQNSKLNTLQIDPQDFESNLVFVSPNDLSITPSPTFQTRAIPSGKPEGNLIHTSQKLGISFEYPAFFLGNSLEFSASEGKGGSAIDGEDWHKIVFDESGFQPGYFEITASTANYLPSSWEGVPHWFNAKITADDTVESVNQKLAEANYQVVKTEKISTSSNSTVFKTWILDCYLLCNLARVYILPINRDSLGNIQIYSILKVLDQNLDINNTEQVKKSASELIVQIETNTADETTLKYIEWQNLILNSLKFEN